MEQSRIGLFDRWAEGYDDSIQTESGLHEGYDRVLDRVVDAAGARPGMRVLDLGIGTGNLSVAFVALGCEVWGVDFSPLMLARARDKLPQVHLVQVDLLAEWPDALDRRYERIVSTYVFHEFDLATKVRMLDRLAHCYLAAQGRIVIGDVAFETVQALRRAGAGHWDDEEHYWVATEAIAACQRVGLHATYVQVSSCGGVFVIEPAPAR
jgi:putative AdoMet-dependent methyltransferase